MTVTRPLRSLDKRPSLALFWLNICSARKTRVAPRASFGVPR
jgi:hypothetical protein